MLSRKSDIETTHCQRWNNLHLVHITAYLPYLCVHLHNLFTLSQSVGKKEGAKECSYQKGHSYMQENVPMTSDFNKTEKASICNTSTSKGSNAWLSRVLKMRAPTTGAITGCFKVFAVCKL